MSSKQKLPPLVRRPWRGNYDVINRLVQRNAFADSGDTYLKQIAAINEWDAMGQKTYRIELKINFAEDENHSVMLTIAKQYARDLLGSAMLLQDKTKPGVVLFAEDSFFNMDEIDLLDESNNIHTP